MEIGLYFGSFNPIHVGHVVIANYILETTAIDELWFVISPQNPLKEKSTLLDDYQRLRMVELAIDDFPHLRASSVEFSLPQPSYTIQTLAHLCDKYPHHTFSLIMGGDNIQSIHKWKNYQRIIENYKIYVYPRPEFVMPPDLEGNPNIEIVNAPLMEISSSMIREWIKQGRNVQGFMPSSAWQYLDEMNFYK
ncbi:MAG: nicotinate-nucleotide adenylyltransferase [Bacteroidales bacterium]|nr:nicotinate-nucleotide adenylyltransferase [Bacteroidales bacterium]